MLYRSSGAPKPSIIIMRYLLFGITSNPAFDLPIGKISQARGEAMLAERTAILVGPRHLQKVPVAVRSEVSGDENIPTDGAHGDISARESALNAEYRRELNTGSTCQPRHIRAAHQKVVRWPDVYDRRAVTIHAGKAWIPDVQASRKRAEDRRIESLSLRHAEQQQANQRLRAAGVA